MYGSSHGIFEGIAYIYLESEESHSNILVILASNQIQLQTEYPPTYKPTWLVDLTLSLLMLHICGVSKMFGDWYQKKSQQKIRIN
jgi:hypothetical protein